MVNIRLYEKLSDFDTDLGILFEYWYDDYKSASRTLSKFEAEVFSTVREVTRKNMMAVPGREWMVPPWILNKILKT